VVTAVSAGDVQIQAQFKGLIASARSTIKEPVLDDDFASSSLDTTKWSIEAGTFTGLVAPVGGHLELRVFAIETNSGLRSICRVAGDFDMQVDFALTKWDDSSVHRVRLFSATTAGGIGVSRAIGDTHGDSYVLTGREDLSSLPSNDSGGALRLVRSGASLTGWAFTGGQWISVGRSSVDVTPVNVILDITSSATSYSSLAITSISNFRVNSGHVVCP